MNRFFEALIKQDIYLLIPEDEVVSKQQYVLFRIFSFAGTFVCIGDALKMLFTIKDAGVLPYLIIALAIIMTINFHRVKRVSQLYGAYVIMLSSAFVLLHIVSYTCGGIRTGGTLYFSSIILYAFMLLGRKGGLWFSAVTILHVVYLYFISTYLQWTSFSFFHEDIELISQDFLINAILTVFLIASQGNYLQSGKNVVIQRLTKSKKLLEDNYALLEEQNAMMNKYAKHLEKTNSELEKFASVASHDLKAPLRAIGNLTDIIEEEVGHLLNDEMQSHFKIIKSRVLRMDALLNALLEYSKADKNREEYNEIAMQPFFEEQLNAVRENTRVSLTFKTDLPMVFCERNKLAKAIRNVLHNAILFNDKDSIEISIAVSDKDDQWLFSIHDNGPGIEARYHEKVFVIFQTLNRRDEKETMGIGLAVARKIIEERGGTIWLDSVQDNGTTVHFTIPKFNTNPNLLQPANERAVITFAQDNIWLAEQRPNLN